MATAVAVMASMAVSVCEVMETTVANEEPLESRSAAESLETTRSEGLMAEIAVYSAPNSYLTDVMLAINGLPLRVRSSLEAEAQHFHLSLAAFEESYQSVVVVVLYEESVPTAIPIAQRVRQTIV